MRGMNDSELCPRVEAAFGLLAKKWMGLIIYTLDSGELHFSDIGKAMPELSARVLTLRVRELEKTGILVRRVSRASPVRVSYRLTKKGKSLAVVIKGIAAWANDIALNDSRLVE
jgi:DNA-binding HxlR family transcriptional regulator